MSKNLFSIRLFVPSFITVLAICAGIASLRSALAGNFFNSLLLLLTASFLDGLDGRVARALKVNTSFGGQLDSLADVINFGVIPPLILYFYILNQYEHLGWIIVVTYTVACCLRLARFNVNLESDNTNEWEKYYFVGLPSPGGALLLLLPIYIAETINTDLVFNKEFIIISSIYAIVISFLLISRFPIANGKALGTNFKIETIIFALLIAGAFISLLMTYLWIIMLLFSIVYFIFIPISYYYWHKNYGNLE
ncbi:phosphatidylcholine/phosphatidylserine synthase [Bartonella sp. DGB1]|uniref:CDP-alcohol phosphatidyltransferase family protein n=1 Tax=Bartonella sp. DGB1 TaxID=3239807 RepID=UPI00352485B0